MLADDFPLSTFPWHRSTWAVRLLFRDHDQRNEFRDILLLRDLMEGTSQREYREKLLAFFKRVNQQPPINNDYQRKMLIFEWMEELEDLLEDSSWDCIGYAPSSTRIMKFQQLRERYGI